MDDFEIGRLLGRLDIILENIPDKKNILDELEAQLKYEYDIMSLAKVYGRLEQKLIIINKSEEILKNLNEMFEDLKRKRTNEFKQKNLEELHLRGLPIKILNNNNIFTVQDLLNKTFEEMASINGISINSVQMLVDKLKRNGVYLKK